MKRFFSKAYEFFYVKHRIATTIFGAYSTILKMKIAAY